MFATVPSGTSATLCWPARRTKAAKDGVLFEAMPTEGRRSAAVELHERHQDRAGGQCATDFVEAHRRPRDLGSFRRALFSEGAFGVFLLLPGLVHQRSRDWLIEAANQQVGEPLPGLLGTLGSCRHLRARRPKRVGASRQLVENQPRDLMSASSTSARRSGADSAAESARSSPRGRLAA